MKKIVVSITGHRLLTPEQKVKVAPVLKKAIENIMFTFNEREETHHFTALTPIAEGADTMFAHAARELGLPIDILLPYERSIYLKGFSSDEARTEFDVIYNDVAVINKRTLSALASHELDALDGDGFNQLFMKLGEQVVDDADYIIAIWNEQVAKGKGGTGDVVAYALDKGREVLVINPEDAHPFINYINPESYTAGGARDPVEHAEKNYIAEYIRDRQDFYDSNAMLFNKKYRKVWTIGFIIGLVEVLAFSLIISFHVALTTHYILASIEFFSIFTLVMMIVFGKTTKYHRKYVHYRIVSERLRIKNYFSKLGFRIHHTIVSPIYTSIKEKPEYSILDKTIRLINLTAYSYLPFDKKKHYLEAELITDQYKYHERKKEKFEKRAHQYKKVREGLFLLFILAVVLHYSSVSNEFFLEHGVHLTNWSPAIFHYEIFEEIVLFVSIFIPATIAACEALKYLYEWEKIISLSDSMAIYFKAKSKELEQTHTEEELEIFLNGINRDMLIENLDWEKYMQDKNEMPT